MVLFSSVSRDFVLCWTITKFTCLYFWSYTIAWIFLDSPKSKSVYMLFQIGIKEIKLKVMKQGRPSTSVVNVHTTSIMAVIDMHYSGNVLCNRCRFR